MSEITVGLAALAVGALAFDAFAYYKYKESAEAKQLKSAHSAQLTDQRTHIIKGIQEKGSASFETDEKPLAIVEDDEAVEEEKKETVTWGSDVKETGIEVDLKDLESDFADEAVMGAMPVYGNEGEKVLDENDSFDAEQSIVELSTSIEKLNKQVQDLRKQRQATGFEKLEKELRALKREVKALKAA